MNKIFVTSYPYVYERYFKVWDYFPEKERLVFILPKIWKAKRGQITIEVPKREEIKIIPTTAFFNHSHYPLVRGLLKGWMPWGKRIIERESSPGDILYTAIEPNLLTTYFNAKLAKRLGLKHVFFTWQNVPYKTRLQGSKLKMVEGLIQKTIANSVGAICGNTKAAEILKEYVGENFKILAAPISGVNVKDFHPDISSDFRQKYNLEEKTVLTFAGVFDERKGIPALLDSFLEAYQENKNLRLVMIGVGKLKVYIEEFVKTHHFENEITLIKWLPNEQLPGVLCASDIFAHPSEPQRGWEEQFGYSMAEASACGIPVIATRSGSIEEIIIDQQSGILIEPGNSRQLKEAILKLAADRHRCGNMGMRGRRHMEENYSHEVVAEKFHQFFEKL